jgi:hypothetical protein
MNEMLTEILRLLKDTHVHCAFGPKAIVNDNEELVRQVVLAAHQLETMYVNCRRSGEGLSPVSREELWCMGTLLVNEGG